MLRSHSTASRCLITKPQARKCLGFLETTTWTQGHSAGLLMCLPGISWANRHQSALQALRTHLDAGLQHSAADVKLAEELLRAEGAVQNQAARDAVESLATQQHEVGWQIFYFLIIFVLAWSGQGHVERHLCACSLRSLHAEQSHPGFAAISA